MAVCYSDNDDDYVIIKTAKLRTLQFYLSVQKSYLI